MNENIIAGCLLGGALGDSLGLPAEGLNAKRIAKFWPGSLEQRLIAGKGMISDDTEHAVMTFLSLIESPDNPETFARRLAGRMRWWFASIPAGIGMATARSIVKLWVGIPPKHSGVCSAGNGPQMRASIIGAFFYNDPEKRETFVDASTRITHTDPRALEAARLIAGAAASATHPRVPTDEIFMSLEKLISSDEMKSRFPLIKECLLANDPVHGFADRITKRPGYVTGFAPDSASVALFSWLRHRGDFAATIEEAIKAGGDTDTIAFIAGSIAGIECGPGGLPEKWLNDLRDWPINATNLRTLSKGRIIRYPRWPLGLIRNGAFLIVVIFHGLRRLLPPY